MDDEVNSTYLLFSGHVEVDKYRYVYFITMFIIYILIICANGTIVYVIWTHENLHEPMYIFIAALLINSVLFSTNIYPKLLIDFLSDKQIISYSACLLQFHIFYSLASSEFLLLAAMSYDRYVSICKPLQYPAIMKTSTVSIMLVLAWLWPACHIAVPAAMIANEKLCSHILQGLFCNNIVYKLHCVISGARIVRDLIILIDIVLLPLIFILFTYTRILIIVYRSSREVRKKAAQTCLPHLILLINYSCLGTYDFVIVGVEPHFPKTVSLIMTFQVILYHPLFNPIIYGVKMTGISKQLKGLFCRATVN
ncbi:hypothetical protein Q5P01_014181 [Channa striata]|uniref:Olfactory receptor n=1 Tax=Channa striata TaxID=64152 RepID=A0AA88MLW9_CHASR|nr:hypothetical protein Q5P01_014181 [Channa striata]